MNWSNIRTKAGEYFSKIWLFLAFILVSGLSFEAGLLQRSLQEAEPLIISRLETVPPPAAPTRVDQIPLVSEKPTLAEAAASIQDGQTGCMFVGSKNSNKYHAPTSRCAKQIKPKNLVCFDSADAAKAGGYLPGCLE